MRKTQSLLLLAGILFAAGTGAPELSFAQSPPQGNLQALIASLQEKIATLERQIEELKVQNQASAVPEVPSSPAPQPIFTRSLQVGSTGEDVRQLQEFLRQFPVIYPEGLVTGYFGSLTRAAVRRWQEAQELEPIGVVGPASRALLNDSARAAPPAFIGRADRPIDSDVPGIQSQAASKPTTAQTPTAPTSAITILPSLAPTEITPSSAPATQTTHSSPTLLPTTSLSTSTTTSSLTSTLASPQPTTTTVSPQTVTLVPSQTTTTTTTATATTTQATSTPPVIEPVPSPTPSPAPAPSPTSTTTPTATADMIVSSTVLHSPQGLVAGKPLSITAFIKNQGSGVSGASAVRFRVDVGWDGIYDLTPGEVSVNSLAPGETQSVTSPEWIAQTGAVSYEVCADIGNAVQETSESNNCYVPSTLPATVAAASVPPSSTFADLVVFSTVFNSPQGLEAGKPISVGATIKNQGAGASDVSAVRFRLDIGGDGTYDVTLGESTLGGLTSGSSQFINSTEWIAQAGTILYEVCVDLGNLVQESNESNNCHTAPASPIQIAAVPTPAPVSTSQIDLTVLPISTYTPQGLGAGKTYSFGANIKNQGSVSSPATTARFRLDVGGDGTYDLTLGEPAVGTLAAGALKFVQSSNWTSQAGTHQIELCADTGSAVDETDETNNCVRQTVSVRVAQGRSSADFAAAVESLRKGLEALSRSIQRLK